MSIQTRIPAGSQIFGRWIIQEALEAGSQSGLFRLTHMDSGTQSALRVVTIISGQGSFEALAPQHKADYAAVREARMGRAQQQLAKLQGKPCTLDCLEYTFFHWNEADSFGTDLLLRTELLSNGSSAGIFPQEELLRMAMALGVALEACHKEQLYHLSLSPEYVFCTPKGDYRLGGFEAALRQNPEASGCTAPEVTSGQYDQRADIYSLGMTLYCLAGGQPPAPGQPLTPLRGISTGLGNVLQRACSPWRQERYQSMAEFLADIRQLRGIPGPTQPQRTAAPIPPVRPAAPVQPAAPRKKRRWLLPLCACLALLIAVGGICAFLLPNLGQDGGEEIGGYQRPDRDEDDRDEQPDREPEAIAPAEADPYPGWEAPASTEAPVMSITLKVWAPQYDQIDENSWLIQMEKAFERAHPEYRFEWKNGVCSESDAMALVPTDLSAAADVYMYSSDQIGTLADAGALMPLQGPYLEQVYRDVSQTYVNSVTHTDGNLYGFPIAPNTWFMYYNKSILTEEDVKSLEACLAKGEVAFDTTNSWYLPAFFFANGCTLFGEAGNDAAAGVQFNNEAGYQAMARLIELVNNEPNFKNSADGYGSYGLRNQTVAAYFSGSWDYASLYEVLGEDLGAAPPPTVLIGGQPKQLKSYAGSKVIGVNPSSQNLTVAMEFAAFLASPEAQLLRFELTNITPAATCLMEHEKIAASIVAKAEMETMARASVVQPTIPEMSLVWTPVADLGTSIINGYVDTSNLREMLDFVVVHITGGG